MNKLKIAHTLFLALGLVWVMAAIMAAIGGWHLGAFRDAALLLA